MSKRSAEEIRKEITQKIVDSIKAGVIPWRQPWYNSTNTGSPANFLSHRRYTGINTLILMFAGIKSLDDETPNTKYWGSANAVLKHVGAHVKKGEKATGITFFSMIPKKVNGVVERDSTGKEKKIPLMREYPVFNLGQFQAPKPEVLLDGRGKFGIVKALLGQYDKVDRKSVTTLAELRQIAHKYLPAKSQPPEGATREEIAEMIHDGITDKLMTYQCLEVVGNVGPDFGPAEMLIKNSGAKIVHGGDRACYVNMPTDTIKMPKKTAFVSMSDYYGAMFHELAHWTKVEDRVGRDLKIDDAKQKYAFEELVAEISSCLLMIELGVPLAQEMLSKSAAYLADWLTRMEDDPKYIFTAATQASKIVDYLLAFIGRQNPLYVRSDAMDDEVEGEVVDQEAA